ncbi:MAG: T9SS type A sorting domain-containing protein [Fibrobacteres bacterium]|nr:T9SS type A sorting domain-containing protein [Fibrobacterota bacterium]
MKKYRSLLYVLLCAPALFASVISDAAASLQPGKWVQVNTNFPHTRFFMDSVSGSGIFNYSDDAVWYPDSQWMMFTGSDHGGLVNPGSFIVYKANTDTWEKRARGTRGDFSHAYSFNTINAKRGIYYHYDHSGPGLLKYDIKTDKWDTVCGKYSNTTPTGMVEWFPEANKMIAFGSDIRGCMFYLDTATNKWVSFGSGIAAEVAYHGLGRYNSTKKVIMFGFGSMWSMNGDSPGYKTYILDSNLTIRQTSICSIFVAHPRAILTYDPSSGDFLIFDRNNGFYSYDMVNDLWKKLPTPTVPIFDADRSPIYTVSAPIPELGVVAFWQVRSSSASGWAATSHMYLYKHNPNSGTAIESNGPDSKTSSIDITAKPNPFNPVCNVNVTLPSKSNLLLNVYNSNGKIIREITSGTYAKGTHSFTWKGVDALNNKMATGLYVLHLTAGNQTKTVKVMLTK